MNTRSAILTILVLLWVSRGTATAQDIDTPERKNAITLSIFPLAVHGFSLSYARKLKNGFELTFNPRFQPTTTEAATEPGTDQGSNPFGLFRFVKPDPQSWYNHYMLRVGLRIPLTRTFGYEPQLQLGYGDFYDKVLQVEDAHGDAFDEYQRMDRVYYSAGIINSVNWVHDWRALRLKVFLGLGTHVRRYEETQYQRYLWNREMEYDGPQKSTYYKAKFSVHGGIEIGVRF